MGIFNPKYMKEVTTKDFTMSKNGNINSKEHEDALLFCGVDWCGHCKRAKGEMEKFAKAYGDRFPVLFLDGDKPENQSLTGKLEVAGFPTIFLIKSNTVIEKYEGERTSSAISNKVCEFTRNGICFRI